MAVMRVEKNCNYTVMANYHLRDKRLSLKAKGLLSVMISLPAEWDYTLAGLAYISKEGVSAIRAAIQELEENGYVTRARLRNEAGQLGDTEYTIFELPQNDGQNADQVSSRQAPVSAARTNLMLLRLCAIIQYWKILYWKILRWVFLRWKILR